MKLLLISDFHLLFERPVGRLDNSHEAQKRKLKYVFEYAHENNCIILQAGDFFDRPRSWRLLSIYIDFFRFWVGEKGVKVYCVRGQHDMYLYNEETNDRTTLGVLAKMGLVRILGKGEVCDFRSVGKSIYVYGVSYGQEVPDPDTEGLNILVIHAPILKGKLWAGQQNYDYAPGFLRKHKGYDLILAGDIHQKFIFRVGERIICNTGCVIRKSVDQWEHRPGFFEYDTETMNIQWHEIPHVPPEEVMSRVHLEKVEQRNEMLNKFIGAVQSQEVEMGMSFKENLIDFMEKNKIGRDVKELIAGVMEGG